ncbi:MAG: tRNA (adenosine(37)-N6)-threonylcarbamoyltransferase complex dimerization subunit type 1 TsaB [Dehalococcoidales bacterium]
MKVLGIDTSGYANAIGIVDDDRILADFTFEARADSLEKIVSNIDFALEKANLSLKDIQGFGVGLGPGSWTGIRVGVTVGKILAYSTNKPVSGVPTLEVLAYAARNVPALICPIINAGTRATVYAAFYRIKNGTVNRVGEYYVGDLQRLSEMIKEPVVFIGSEAQSYRQLISQALNSSDINLEAIEDVPKGSIVALLAAARLKREESDDVLSLEPLYLKESTARAFMGRYSRSAQAKG